MAQGVSNAAGLGPIQLGFFFVARSSPIPDRSRRRQRSWTRCRKSASNEFSNPYGKPYKARRRFMAGLCKRASIRGFGFHALRHFVASVLDSKNVPLKQIQLILGHSKPTTTDRYLGNIHQGQKVFMDRISEALIPETIPENKKGENDKNR